MSRSVLTLRAEERTVAALRHLSRVVGRPVNQIVVEAIEGYLDRRTREVEQDLEAQIRGLRAYRDKDAGWEDAIAEFAEAESVHDDPVEGDVAPPAGPASRGIRDLLSR
jgi:predicted transcriptional regulator